MREVEDWFDDEVTDSIGEMLGVMLMAASW